MLLLPHTILWTSSLDGSFINIIELVIVPKVVGIAISSCSRSYALWPLMLAQDLVSILRRLDIFKQFSLFCHPLPFGYLFQCFLGLLGLCRILSHLPPLQLQRVLPVQPCLRALPRISPW